MQRHMVGVLADDQVRQQARPRQPLGDRHRRLGRRDHHLATVQWLARWGRHLGPLILARGRLARANRLRSHGRQVQRWLGICLRRWHGLGLLARVRWPPRGLGPPLATARADIFVDEVLDHEQARRPVIELLAPVRPDIDADLAAGRTGALDLGQFVVPGLAG
jgi:hypothetical protein